MSLIRMCFNPRAAFTLAEMIIVVAVMAILLTAASPSLFQLLRQRDTQDEDSQLQQVRQAIVARLKETNTMPRIVPDAAGNDWATDLAGYTSLSEEQIRNDVWGNPRAYVSTSRTVTIEGARLPVYYATVMSRGPDRKAESGVTGVAVNDMQEFQPPIHAAWWSAQGFDRTAAQVILDFANLGMRGDDRMVKFTDYSEKLAKLAETGKRMEMIANALENYAKTQYAAALGVCENDANANPACTDAGGLEKIVYYPRALPIKPSSDDDPLNRYATWVDDLYSRPDVQGNNNAIVDNTKSDAGRRADMERLMKVLGLPDAYCCSAYESDTNHEPKAFYYFSNPRPRHPTDNTVCNPRPGKNDIKLPARVVTTHVSDGFPNPTCG